MAELLQSIVNTTESLVLIEEENLIFLSSDPIDFNKLVNLARTSKSGSVSTFIGTTRDSFEGKVSSTTVLQLQVIYDIVITPNIFHVFVWIFFNFRR